ncbi:MAG: response regulator [Methylococcales bacterium]|jgi:twitching motility two-component system response regulator PilH|nr:response regulator [Methylococcales bacterium]MBT7409787.1 response regulator [Methylococcales bacterium]
MKQVLIVDDSPEDCKHLTKIMEKNDFSVITADDGEKGVEKAKQEKPDLILMDVVMPNLNGFQATRKIKKNPDTADIPVIMITTKSNETDKIWAKRQGVDIFITKPVKANELNKAIEEIFE